MTSLSDRKTLLFFVSEDWFFCSHFLERAKAASTAGYEVVILTRTNHHAVAIKKSGLRLIHINFDRRSMNPFVILLTVMRLVAIYMREKPLLVHQVALKPILLGSLAARLANVPFIVNAVVGGGYAFISNKLSMRILRPILLFSMRVLLNPPCSKVVFENSDDLETYVRTGLVKNEDAVLIRGAGVEPGDFQSKIKKAYPPIVLLVARLLWDKGIGEFAEAANILRQRGLNARFVIVGAPDPENLACIDSSTLEAWKVEGRVELWGFRSDVPEILSVASIACLPSYREGLPKSLLEAMAASLPCVATDVPGCREAVIDGDNGLLIPVKSASSLADAIEFLLRNPELAKKMGERGRTRLEQEFSSREVNERTLGLYQQIIVK
jgi:glycosyltransferase involved in cell wall biosynthesis